MRTRERERERINLFSFLIVLEFKPIVDIHICSTIVLQKLSLSIYLNRTIYHSFERYAYRCTAYTLVCVYYMYTLKWYCVLIFAWLLHYMKPNYFYQIEKNKTKNWNHMPCSNGEHNKCVLICMHMEYTVCTTIPFMNTITIKYIVHNKFMANLISFISNNNIFGPRNVVWVKWKEELQSQSEIESILNNCYNDQKIQCTKIGSTKTAKKKNRQQQLICVQFAFAYLLTHMHTCEHTKWSQR